MLHPGCRLTRGRNTPRRCIRRRFTREGRWAPYCRDRCSRRRGSTRWATPTPACGIPCCSTTTTPRSPSRLQLIPPVPLVVASRCRLTRLIGFPGDPGFAYYHPQTMSPPHLQPMMWHPMHMPPGTRAFIPPPMWRAMDDGFRRMYVGPHSDGMPDSKPRQDGFRPQHYSHNRHGTGTAKGSGGRNDRRQHQRRSSGTQTNSRLSTPLRPTPLKSRPTSSYPLTELERCGGQPRTRAIPPTAKSRHPCVNIHHST